MGRTIRGTAADDTLRGGNGNDFIYGEDGNDTIYGRGGNDNLIGGRGSDVLYGGDGNDTGFLSGGHNVFNGDAGDDFCYDSSGKDTIDGGGDFDLIAFDPGTQGAVVDLGTGIVSNDGYGNVEQITAIEGIWFNTNYADHFTGNAGDNILSVSIGDQVFGAQGDDVLKVESIAGATIDGGAGVDTIDFTGTYHDVSGSGVADHGVTVKLATQTVVDDGFGNSATITGVESATGAYQADTLSGNGRANTLFGENGDDRLRGMNGDDVLHGGLGNDILTGGHGADTFIYLANFGTIEDQSPNIGPGFRDLITDFEQGSESVPGDRIDLSSIAASIGGITFTGSAASTGAIGELRYEFVNGDTIVSLETNGQAGADLTIQLTGQIALTTNDFII